MRAGLRRSGWLPALATAVTVVLSALGMAARARAAPLWPAVLADWSVGSPLLSLSAVGVGAVLARKVPRNVVGWLFLALGPLTALVFALRWSTVVALGGAVPPASVLWSAWMFAWVIPVNMTMLAVLALLFPHGRALSQRWRVATIVLCIDGAICTVATMVTPYIPDQTPFAHLANPAALFPGSIGRGIVDVTTSLMLLGLVAGAGSLMVRLRRADGRERQQVKWFVFAVVLAFTTFLVGFWIEPVFIVATLIALPAVPVAAAIAVLRYRLYDIDRVINRTVVYALVTGVLAASYLLAVAGLRALLFNADGAPPVAASTLAVAALFQPVRRRIQAAVDRRFNRATYDAQATVTALRTRVRDEIDLDTLKGELLTTVRATMQPAGTALWLREVEQ